MVVAVLGAAVAIGTSMAARAAHEDNEERLLRQRTREAAAVLEAAIPGIEVPLATSAALAEVVDPGDEEAFRRALGAQVGPGALFLSASVWPAADEAPTFVEGDQPLLSARPRQEIRRLLDRAVATATMIVVDLLDEEVPRLGYAVSGPEPGGRFVVYAEQALPVERTAVVQPDSAFEGLDYSVHLGREATDAALVFASTPDLPLDGLVETEEIPFGDQVLLLTMAPAEDLGGGLLAQLRLVVLAAGLLTTAGAAALTETLQRRRRHAEALAGENEALLVEQRGTSAALQRSLLPAALPAVAGLEIETRYVAGVAGTYVGGDWYDVIDTPDATVVVVGDVSGRGLAAVSAMAAMRHTVRTLALLGLAPDEILTEADRLDERREGGHFASAVCVAYAKAERTITVADAGHPRPLVLTADGAGWVDVPVGPPIGFGPPTHRHRTVTVPVGDGAVLLLVTDGLFERRGETIDDSAERLRAVAGASGLVAPDAALGPRVDALIEEMTGARAADDTVVVAIRWPT